jgi:hypothetical protein
MVDEHRISCFVKTLTLFYHNLIYHPYGPPQTSKISFVIFLLEVSIGSDRHSLFFFFFVHNCNDIFKILFLTQWWIFLHSSFCQNCTNLLKTSIAAENLPRWVIKKFSLLQWLLEKCFELCDYDCFGLELLLLIDKIRRVWKCCIVHIHTCVHMYTKHTKYEVRGRRVFGQCDIRCR